MRLDRRQLLRGAGATALSLPLMQSWLARPARADHGRAARMIVFYFPDGVAGPSQDGQPSAWHATGSEHAFQLSPQLSPLERHREECLFFRGLSMGGADSGSHPGGAKKLLTGVDGGNGESVDQFLARTAGARAPHRHLYLGAMANQNNASGDKHISYPSAGRSVAPEDNPLRAFERLFGAGRPRGGGTDPRARLEVSVIDGMLADFARFRSRVGAVEQRKLDLHLESLRELEQRIKASPVAEETAAGDFCAEPRAPNTTLGQSELYHPERFPEILRLQLDLAVEALACNLTQVVVIQASHHTSELIMSRFPGTPMHDPGFDMRSHQASHYGNRHDRGRREYRDFVLQRQWWAEQFAYLLDRLRERREGQGSLLDHTTALLCTEVCDGNTHLHDDMPFVLAGRAGGAIRPGRLLQYGYERHGALLAAMAWTMGQQVGGWGDGNGGPLAGVLG